MLEREEYRTVALVIGCIGCGNGSAAPHQQHQQEMPAHSCRCVRCRLGHRPDGGGVRKGWVVVWRGLG
jgi:hypothetical protein